jgi:hypothetical protein
MKIELCCRARVNLNPASRLARSQSICNMATEPEAKRACTDEKWAALKAAAAMQTAGDAVAAAFKESMQDLLKEFQITPADLAALTVEQRAQLPGSLTGEQPLRALFETQIEDGGNGTTYEVLGVNAERLIRELARLPPEATLEEAIATLRAIVNGERTQSGKPPQIPGRPEDLDVSGDLFRELCADTEEAGDGETSMSLDNFLHHAQKKGFCSAVLDNDEKGFDFADLPAMRTILIRSMPTWA